MVKAVKGAEKPAKKAVKKAVSVDEAVMLEDLPSKVSADLKKLLDESLTLKEQEESLKLRAAEVRMELEIRYQKYGLKSVLYNDYATIRVEHSGQSTFDKSRAMELLMKAGVKLAVIEKAFREATKQGTPYSFMQVRKLKGVQDQV